MRASVQTKEVREAILDATDKFLALYGYKKMTIDDLAAEVGIGKGSVYLHFPSKEEIALSHIDRIIDRLCAELERIAREESNSSPEKLRKMLMLRVIFRFESVQHYSQSINEILSSLRVKLIERRKNYHRKEALIFAGVIREGQLKNQFIEADAELIAETFLLATNSLLPFSLSTKELGEPAEISEKTSRIAEILLRGISIDKKV